MPKFDVYVKYTYIKHLGTYEAETEAKAITLAQDEEEEPILCYQCTEALGDSEPDGTEYSAEEV